MSVIAELLHAQGHTVSGSDRLSSPVLENLRGLGIDAYSPHDAHKMPTSQDTVVVVSSAIRDSNPEIQKARQTGLQIIHRSVALMQAAQQQKMIAVAGTHGKTTTSAMTVCALAGSGLDPSYAIGASLPGKGSGARLGTDPILVAEADESDASFLNYAPAIAVVTNVEADHLDHYGTAQALHQVFLDFVGKITQGGTLICCAEDSGASELVKQATLSRPDLQVLTYGLAESNAIRIEDVHLQAQSCSFSLRTQFASLSMGNVRVSLCKTGMHNVFNAAGAWTAAVCAGADPYGAAAALLDFQGAARRFELRGAVSGRQIYDDYAHHPTEVRAAIAQARLAAQGQQVIVVFQPHLFSRTRIFQRDFAKALKNADQVVLAPIYAARENPEPGVSSALLACHLHQLDFRNCQLANSRDEAVLLAAKLAAPGDIVLAVGAGDINQATSVAVDYWNQL